ncbi:phosphonopyruvate decarboxylase [Candidatus Woesearchaeota archaeon]|nr:phosphonopyruvate decarboxylase [Candidatus Woesearchaeota archaeon]
MRCEQMYRIFKKNGITFYSGVPDSTFKPWMSYLADEHGAKLTNIIACNECEAVANAAGYHLATGNVGVVYMQNAGQGKTVNPITSLCDTEVYGIPLILMIGWRGEPDKKDEPQHKKMGKVMIPLLETLEIPYEILPDNEEQADRIVESLKVKAMKNSQPVALIIKKKTFEDYEPRSKQESAYEMMREEAIKAIVDKMDSSAVIVSTTGKTSRELFEYRIAKGQQPSDFLMVGSMGCAGSAANAVALEKPEKQVYIFDGDGAVLMQMGSLATIGHYGARNLYHIVFDNQSYESTGGQPTVSGTVDIEKVALACGYNGAATVETKDQLEVALDDLVGKQGPQMLIVKVKKGSRDDLGRPTKTPVENKEAFMEKLRQ